MAEVHVVCTAVKLIVIRKELVGAIHNTIPLYVTETQTAVSLIACVYKENE
ncbi:hypothetical protein [Sporomusa malonica]|uniref:hypothetical protein n=1 Tax=Sporomusa malonica TaxID=112901 RepID=UPI0015942507|nr:hypothetical protein [Sporomusa malonica]